MTKANPNDLHNAYNVLLLTAKHRALPISFKTDLTKHDRAAIARREPGTAFAWILRDSGTHLVWIDSEPNMGPHYSHDAIGEIRCICDTFSDVRGLYFWTGSQLLGSEHMTRAELERLIRHSSEWRAQHEPYCPCDHCAA